MKDRRTEVKIHFYILQCFCNTKEKVTIGI